MVRSGWPTWPVRSGGDAARAGGMAAASDPVVAARLRALGAEPVGSSAAELAASIRTEDEAWAAAARADVRR